MLKETEFHSDFKNMVALSEKSSLSEGAIRELMRPLKKSLFALRADLWEVLACRGRTASLLAPRANVALWGLAWSR